LVTSTYHRSMQRAKLRCAATTLAWSACLVAAAAFVGACSAQAAGGATPSGAITPGGAMPGAPASVAAAARGSSDTGGSGDWAHVLQVVANLRARPPAGHAVLLLGGSAARESTIDDASWTAQVKSLGGSAVTAYNLGSSNRTLEQDVALIDALPRTTGLVYISINVGRFTAAPSQPTLDLPEPAATLPPYSQHHYSQKRILSVAKKKAVLKDWLVRRYPVFKKNYASNLATLEQLLTACRARGLRPVLLELPRDTAVIGHALDTPVARYTSSCRALAKKHGVPWVSFVGVAHVPNADFYDLWHLVEPGRATWQRLLSAKTVALLKKYGMGGGT
jgi:hypothetical protein